MEDYEIGILNDIVQDLSDNLDRAVTDEFKEVIIEQILALEKAIKILEKNE